MSCVVLLMIFMIAGTAILQLTNNKGQFGFVIVSRLNFLFFEFFVYLFIIPNKQYKSPRIVDVIHLNISFL